MTDERHQGSVSLLEFVVSTTVWIVVGLQKSCNFVQNPVEKEKSK